MYTSPLSLDMRSLAMYRFVPGSIERTQVRLFGCVPTVCDSAAQSHQLFDQFPSGRYTLLTFIVLIRGRIMPLTIRTSLGSHEITALLRKRWIVAGI